MKCTDWETYEAPTPAVMCSVCIEEYTGYGPATVRMVSSNGPPLPMPMQVPPGHMVQQIVDENGILTHVILSPQPPGMMSNPMTVGFYGGPNSTAQYYQPYGGPYASHPQYPSTHHHTHAPPPHVHGVPHTHPHGTPPPPNCNSHNHGPIHHPSGPSPPLNSMEDRNIRQRIRVRKKYQARVEDGMYSSYRDRIPPRRAKQATAAKGMNGDVSHPNLIAQSSSTHLGSEPESEIEEERRVLQQQLSSMPEPQITDIEARSALIHLAPPEFDQNEFDINPADFGYELSLSDKGRDGKYKIVYNGDATEITLKDLKPATEFHLRVCALLDDLRGNPTDPISFKTLPCEPDPPQPPKLIQKTKTTLMMKWGLPCENGAKISTYTLEYDEGLGTGNFVEIYNGLQRQHKVSKLQASTRYTFRLAAINSVGKSGFSEPVTFYTNGSVPTQPDPPMLSECSVHALTVSWIRRQNDDEFVLQFEDESTGHGFIPIYNGQNLSFIKDGLRRNAAYKFRLAAKNEEGQSKWSEIVAYHTSPDRPSPPGKPQIKGKIYANSFRVTWDPPKDSGGSEITKYIVELDDGKGYEMLYEGSEREHTCDHLIPGQTYRVRVACSSKGGRSEFSECCVATTQCVPPGQCHAPKLQGKPKATSLHLRWAYPDYNGGVPVTDFSVQMILPDNTSREVYKGRDLDCIVAGLSPGRPFLFQVRAFNRAGGGPWSELLEVISGAGIPDPPKIPLINCKSSHSAIVSWEEPVNNGATITDYRLEWQLKTESDFTQLYFGPNLCYEVKGLSPAVLYSFRVQALNSAGPGLYSPVATCVTPPSRPSAVLSIKAQASATSVHLQWHEPNNNGSEIVSYNIDIGEKQLISINAVTEYVIEDLMPETAYKIRIQAVNAIGVGAFSSATKVTTRTLPPSPPKIECVAGPNNLRLKWGEGRNLDLITYRLEMEREDGNYQEIYRGQAYSFKVGRLAELTEYVFRILASNDAGDGPYSDTYSFCTTKTSPPALRAPKVENVDLTTAQVSWQSCRSLGSDAMVYMLQLQDKDQDYHEVYKGADTYFLLQNLQPKTDYQVRVCAIRESNDDNGDIMGAFSPGTGFVTRNPEPVEKAKPVVKDDSVTEPKQMSIQQMTAIAVGVFFLISVLIAFIIQQFIAYMTPSSRS
ncbi:hypothetical protein ACJMK2_017848 [Sinanodonta woodiana]|uniref:Fibronectin type-III domain-containing protein n=1 Tax=Sinanodonta woodiana TaxID=1069815 RepID=A0ABD3UD77_SINWO